jgi:hypothetical protein
MLNQEPYKLGSSFRVRWVITKNHLKDGATGIEGFVNYLQDSDKTMESNPQKFSLYDDDGECYAEGMLYSTDKAYNTQESLFSPLHDFGMPHWGCTQIKVDGEFV